MATAEDLRAARAELQKMQADMADDKAFGLFSPALQRRITDTKKAIADLTVEIGKQRDAARRLKDEQKKVVDEEQRINRIRLAAVAAGIVAYKKLESSLRSLREAGMANTIEANQQQIAYELLGREVAGIFLPATKAATNATLASAKALSTLTEGGQNVALVIGSAAAGLVAFSVAGAAATAMGLKFTGVLAGMMRWLPLIGLGGGLIAGLGFLFLQTADGADLMNKALEKGVQLLNEMSKGVETLKGEWGNGGWLDRETTNIALGLSVIGEKLGILQAGTAKAVFDADVSARKNYKPKAGDKPTPGNFQFENTSSAAFERVQLAAAKSSIGGKDTPEKQLEVEQEQLKVLEQLRDGGWVNKKTGMFGSGSDF